MNVGLTCGSEGELQPQNECFYFLPTFCIEQNSRKWFPTNGTALRNSSLAFNHTRVQWLQFDSKICAKCRRTSLICLIACLDLLNCYNTDLKNQICTLSLFCIFLNSRDCTAFHLLSFLLLAQRSQLEFVYSLYSAHLQTYQKDESFPPNFLFCHLAAEKI